MSDAEKIKAGDFVDLCALVESDTISVDLWYPRHSPAKFVEVGLMDVRAADSIRISYDFDRDGYKIEQAVYFEDDGIPMGGDEWHEVAFIQAWALEKEPTQ